jgi:AcrR family transcriptional regulator
MSPRPKKHDPLLEQAPGDGMDMRSRILLKAKQLFRVAGYSAVSINDIVRAVGITKPTLYHYFKDKETLFDEVLVDMMQRGASYIREGIKGKTTLRDRLISLTEGYLHYSPMSMTAMIRDAMAQLSEPSRAQVMSAYQESFLIPLEALFQEALTKGELSPSVNTADLAMAFVSLLDSYTLNRTAVSGRVFDYKEQAHQLVTMIMFGIMQKKDDDDATPY